MSLSATPEGHCECEKGLVCKHTLEPSDIERSVVLLEFNDPAHLDANKEHAVVEHEPAIPREEPPLQWLNDHRLRKSESRWLSSMKWTKWLLFLVLVETVLDITILVYLYLRFDRILASEQVTSVIVSNRRRFPVYLAIFGLAHLWQLMLAVDGAYQRNTIQVVGLSVFNALFLSWTVLQISEIEALFASVTETHKGPDSSVSDAIYSIPVTALTGTMLGVISAVEIGLLGLSWFVYKEIGWQVYHDLGADLQVKRCNLHHQIFVCVLRFAAFFFTGFGIQFIWLVLYQAKDAEYWATIALLPISLMVLALGAVAAHKESRATMSGFLVALFGVGSYFVYKTVRIYQARDTFREVYKSLTVFSALSVAVTVMVMVWSIVVMCNFGKGLRTRRELLRRKNNDERRKRHGPRRQGPMVSNIANSGRDAGRIILD